MAEILIEIILGAVGGPNNDDVEKKIKF